MLVSAGGGGSGSLPEPPLVTTTERRFCTYHHSMACPPYRDMGGGAAGVETHPANTPLARGVGPGPVGAVKGGSALTIIAWLVHHTVTWAVARPEWRRIQRIHHQPRGVGPGAGVQSSERRFCTYHHSMACPPYRDIGGGAAGVELRAGQTGALGQLELRLSRYGGVDVIQYK